MVGRKMEAKDIAEIVLDKVIKYCNKEDAPLECLTKHTPNQLSCFAYLFLAGKNDEVVELIEKSDKTFWDEMEKEYSNLWNERIVIDIGNNIGDILGQIVEFMVQYDEIDDARKVRLLKAYDALLDKFGKAINESLKNSKPMNKGVLHDWLKKVGRAGSMDNANYNDEISKLVNFYNEMGDNNKLRILSIILDEIGDDMYDLEEKYIPDLINT